MSAWQHPWATGRRSADQPFIAGVGVSALLIGFLAIALALGSGHPQVRAVGHPESIVFVAIIGWSFIACGLLAWTRRSHGFGALMIIAGFAWFFAELTASNRDFPYSVGLLISSVWLAVFFHALMRFPERETLAGPEVFLVAALYGLFTVGQLSWLLLIDSQQFFDCPECPTNLLQVADAPDVATRILLVQQPIAAVVAIVGGTIVLSRRWMAAGPHQRRGLTPVYVSGMTCLLVAAFVLAVDLYWPDATDLASWASGLAFSAVPLAFAIGVVREGLDRSAVGDLIVQLTASEGEGDLQNMMAVALRDPTLELVYWLDNRAIYVDREGRPSDPPRATSTRAVTYVTQRGNRVAALVHDPFLKREDELLKGVCAAAALSLANERLQAELKARLEDLRKSRARIVRASDAERRRIERNLHDGAQQRLLSLSLSLQDAERRTSDSEASRIIHEAREELARTVTELRDLAQGLHPAVLVDHGLAVALESSVASSAIPTQLRVAVETTIPPQVEVAAYYVVTEALVNIAKHAHANRATVDVSTRNGDLIVEVADDGVGGADITNGSGLLGLSDRVGALDGRLEVSDRPGGGTIVRAAMPCG